MRKVFVHVAIDSKSMSVFFRDQGIYLFMALVVGRCV